MDSSNFYSDKYNIFILSTSKKLARIGNSLSMIDAGRTSSIILFAFLFPLLVSFEDSNDMPYTNSCESLLDRQTTGILQLAIIAVQMNISSSEDFLDFRIFPAVMI